MLKRTGMLVLLGLGMMVSSAEARQAGKADRQMSGEQLQVKVDKAVTKAEARMNKAMGKRAMTPDQSDKMKKRFDTKVAKVNGLAQKAASDSVVTRDEARHVSKAARSLTAKGDKGKANKGKANKGKGNKADRRSGGQGKKSRG